MTTKQKETPAQRAARLETELREWRLKYVEHVSALMLENRKLKADIQTLNAFLHPEHPNKS